MYVYIYIEREREIDADTEIRHTPPSLGPALSRISGRAATAGVGMFWYHSAACRVPCTCWTRLRGIVSYE